MASRAGSRSAMMPRLDRRKFLSGAGAFGLSVGATAPALAQPTNPEYTIKIAPVSVELAPGKLIQTYGYNGTVRGPVLRLQENRQVSIQIMTQISMTASTGTAFSFRPTWTAPWKKDRRWSPLTAVQSSTRSPPNQPGHAGITATMLPGKT